MTISGTLSTLLPAACDCGTETTKDAAGCVHTICKDCTGEMQVEAECTIADGGTALGAVKVTKLVGERCCAQLAGYVRGVVTGMGAALPIPFATLAPMVGWTSCIEAGTCAGDDVYPDKPAMRDMARDICATWERCGARAAAAGGLSFTGATAAVQPLAESELAKFAACEGDVCRCRDRAPERN